MVICGKHETLNSNIQAFPLRQITQWVMRRENSKLIKSKVSGKGHLLDIYWATFDICDQCGKSIYA